MSRGNIRPKPSQGQITATSCNVILNAQAHSKSKGKSKAETGSPGVRSLGKEKNTACTQERKLEENGCSSETGVTLIGPSVSTLARRYGSHRIERPLQCISANASNKNTEIHDSNNKSTPKHITTSSSKGGHINQLRLIHIWDSGLNSTSRSKQDHSTHIRNANLTGTNFWGCLRRSKGERPSHKSKPSSSWGQADHCALWFLYCTDTYWWSISGRDMEGSCTW